LTDPAQAVTTPAATRTSTGVYTLTYTPVLTGTYSYYFLGSGANAGAPAMADIFTVNPGTTGALVSLAEMKSTLNITPTNTVNDAKLMGFIHAATSIINRECGYTAPTVFTETVEGRADNSGRQFIVLARTPVLSVATITPTMQGFPTIDLSTLNITTESGIVYTSNWFPFYGPVNVTYTAGRPSIPSALREACLLIVQDMWDTQRGGATRVPSFGGNEDSGDATQGLPYRALQLMRMSPYDAAPGIA
jgi:hypothetical protein